jgi:mRNA interferase HigB
MKIISLKRIREFVASYPDAEPSLMAWYRTAKRIRWENLIEIRQTYPTADLVGRHTVFNIKGNKYRLIARIVYRSQTLFVVAVLMHAEYDQGKWKE